MNRPLSATVLAAALALPAMSQAANHYVRADATGNGSGSDWTNASRTLPTRLVRGDTYYLGAGNYGAHTFDDADNGTQAISIVRATATNHGTDTGWKSTYNTGTATFTQWTVLTDWYVFDGQRRNADWATGATDQYGLRVSGTGPVMLDDWLGHGSNHVTFRYVDIVGGGRDNPAADDAIWGAVGNSWMTWQYCAIHDSGRTLFFMRGNWQNMVVDHTYMARNTSNANSHGELLSMNSSTHVVWSNNWMEDIEGTGFLVGISNGTAADWDVFGNVALHTAKYFADSGSRPEHSWGVAAFIYVAHDDLQTNFGNDWRVHDNTFVDLKGVWSGVHIEAGTGNVVRNNVWYAAYDAGQLLGTGGTIDHNWYYQTPHAADTSPTTVTCTTNCAIFVNHDAHDFHLVRALGGAQTLPAPATVDMDGVTRGINGAWDVGAYQFRGTALSKQAAPRYLQGAN